VFAVQLWLARTTKSTAGAYAIDPVCGMQVQTANAPAHRHYAGQDVWFCADRCAERFDREPEKYLAGHVDADAMDEPVNFLGRKPGKA
jgi:YHS domain-containing protein